MEEIEGPLGFTDMDAEGMLVEGFDQLSTMATIYNYPYYPQHMEKLGFEKSADWVEMKIYIPEQQIGKIHLGSEAHINVDAYRDKYFVGKVSKISDQAQFTPKNVETKEERVKLVFAVEVAVENQESVLKPGMPGDVILRWKEDLPWMKLN